MDEMRLAFWHAFVQLLPAGAEMHALGEPGPLVISWPMPAEGRPNRRARELAIYFERNLAAVWAASDEPRRPLLAQGMAEYTRRVLNVSDYRPDGDDVMPFRVHLDDRAIE